MQKGPVPQDIPAPPYPGNQMGAQSVGMQINTQPPTMQTVTQVVVVNQRTLRDVPDETTCPHCRNTVVTVTKHQPGLLTWLICGGIGLLMCWPCCLIPFCVDACKDVHHQCPSCQQVIHIYKHM